LANSCRSIDQFAIAEQMADDPQVEASRDVLGVLEQVLELAVAGDVGIVIEVQPSGVSVFAGGPAIGAPS
jgi:hypothetical protein